MQCDKGPFYALFIKPCQHGLIKMQAGRRRSHCPRCARIDRLITLAIPVLILTLYIRRQGHVPFCVKHLMHRLPATQAQMKERPLPAQHLKLRITLRRQTASRLRHLADAQLRQQLMLIQHPLHHDLDPTTAVLVPEQACR